MNSLVSQKVKKEIFNLYFNEMYSIDQIIDKYNRVYSYATIKSVLNEAYK